MTVYSNIYDAAVETAHILRKQVATALRKTATDVMNEAPNVPDHAQRVAWARRVLSDPAGWSAKAIWLVLDNPTIQAAPTNATDNDVQFVCNGLVAALMKAT